jgi:uncharacterized protein YjbI with pentapeptide repeats
LYGANLSGANLSGANLYGTNLSGTTYHEGTFNKGLLQLIGLKWPILFLDTHIKIGCKFYSTNEWDNFTDEEINKLNSEALDFWQAYKDLIITIANKHQNP